MKKINLKKGTKTMKKASKLTALILTMVLLIASVCFMAAAESLELSEESGFPEYLTCGDWEYTILEDGTVAICYYFGDDTKIEIPAKLDGYEVTELYWICDSFDGGRAEKIEEVIIPEGIRFINGGAFEGANLKTVFIPKTVVEITGNPFGWNSSLETIVVDKDNPIYTSGKNDNVIIEKETNTLITGINKIPSTVTKIECCAFVGNSNLKEIVIPDSVTEIGELAFWACESLESVKMSKNVTEIKGYVFDGCCSLSNIDLPENITSIGGYSFYCCGSLEEIKLPENLEYIGESAFESCGSLQVIAIPEKVKEIGAGAFNWCTNLYSVKLQDGLTQIGTWAFSGTNLKSVYIPKTVTEISGNPFTNNVSLETIVVDSENPVYDSRDNCNAIIETATNTLITGTNKIPSSVNAIGNGAFVGNENLVNLEIPSSVSSIGEYAFEECTNLKSVIIPNSITEIGNSVFNGCLSLERVTIPNSVTSIGDWAFYECTSLTNITIPDSVTFIGEYAFDTCVENFAIQGYTGSYAEKYADWNGMNFVSIGIAELKFFIDETGTIIGYTGVVPTILEIPSEVDGIKVTAIGDYVFGGNSIEKVIIPEGVTTLGMASFGGCVLLRNVTLPKSLTEINGAFECCEDITFEVYSDSYAAEFARTWDYYRVYLDEGIKGGILNFFAGIANWFIRVSRIFN